MTYQNIDQLIGGTPLLELAPSDEAVVKESADMIAAAIAKYC